MLHVPEVVDGQAVVLRAAPRRAIRMQPRSFQEFPWRERLQSRVIHFAYRHARQGDVLAAAATH